MKTIKKLYSPWPNSPSSTGEPRGTHGPLAFEEHTIKPAMSTQPAKHLINFGVFTLHSGEISNIRIDCDALTDEDITAAAAYFNNLIKPRFHKVVGIPRGGERLARAMEKYVEPDGVLTLVVDDVATTGNSLKEEGAKHKHPYYLVLFDRRPLQLMQLPVISLFELSI